MRFYIVFIWLSFIGFAQQSNQTPYYVWAKSGLSLRLGANTTSEKISTIPYGATVDVLSFDNNTFTVEEFKGFTYTTNWVKVKYNEIEGYAFYGYLSMVKPPQLNANASTEKGLLDYLKHNYKVLEKKIISKYEGCGDETYCEKEVLYTFENGITYSSWSGEGGGTETLGLPNTNLLQAFILASFYCDMYKDFETVYSESPLPTIVVNRDDVGCDFTITCVDGFAIILWSGGC